VTEIARLEAKNEGIEAKKWLRLSQKVVFLFLFGDP
jgi:hypothetical protein